jgi:hypothetical protein
MNFRLILATAALLAALPINTAYAAPQMLGLLADGTLPMHCADGACTVEVSAICLQEERDIPAWGTAYRAVQPNLIALVGTGPDGGEISRPVGDVARIESARGSWAVKISIPQATVRALGISKASLAIEGRVALAPVAAKDDPEPQTTEEIGAAVAAFGKSSETIVGGTAVDMAAAHVVNEMINTLPHVTLDPSKPAGDLWRKTFGMTMRPGMQKAEAFYRLCGHKLLLVKPDTVRRCLELGHDGFVTNVNQRYWDSNQPGV